MASVGEPEPLEQLWDGPPSWTAAQIAAEIGCDEAHVRRVWRLLGFPDPEQRVQFFVEDVEFLRIQSEGEALFGVEYVEHMTRAVGAGTRGIMEATLSLAPESFGDVAKLPPEEAELLAAAAGALLLRLINSLPALLKHQAREAFLFTPVDATSVQRTMCVGFCDLVGSTQLTNESPFATGQAITAFETYATEEIAQRGGRLIKFVGDEVMFATVELSEAHEIAVALVQWVSEHDHLSLARVGIACGPVVYRDGDLYGATVNLAARLAGLAEPDTILVADDAAHETIAVRGFADLVHVRTTRRT